MARTGLIIHTILPETSLLTYTKNGSRRKLRQNFLYEHLKCSVAYKKVSMGFTDYRIMAPLFND